MTSESLQEQGYQQLPVEIGRPFPDLVLPSVADGGPVSISEFRGHKLALHVFASW